MANRKIEDVEGIGAVVGDKLRAAGIKDTDSLLAAAKTAAQRKTLAETTGLGDKQVLKFANMVDLFRVHGIGPEYAELLEAAGVDTVPELARRRPDNLTTALVTANETRNLVRRPPSETEVTKWVAEAKDLPRALEY